MLLGKYDQFWKGLVPHKNSIDSEFVPDTWKHDLLFRHFTFKGALGFQKNYIGAICKE